MFLFLYFLGFAVGSIMIWLSMKLSYLVYTSRRHEVHDKLDNSIIIDLAGFLFCVPLLNIIASTSALLVIILACNKYENYGVVDLFKDAWNV